ncbi:malate:quinone oxidoreductase [Glutamicibacter halophytocola]|uniref:malate:quinone oxidoreductase n=1 Tax=Glutamicibacter halophytocola TaxID=1933880 RepID=UPI003D28BE09
MPSETSTESFDVVLIGAGIMSATLGTLINQLEPTWSIGLFENLDQAGQESSSPLEQRWNRPLGPVRVELRTGRGGRFS